MTEEHEPSGGCDRGHPGDRLSDRKLEANRINALRSTGPRTTGGKARSSLNAIKYPALYGMEDPSPETERDARLSDELDADSRVERIPRMPTDGAPLKDVDRKLALANIRDYVVKRKLISYKQLARMTGASTSAISELLNDKYRGDVDSLIRLCDSAIADYARRQDAPENAQFVPTRFAQRIFAILKLASKMQTIAVIYCTSGTGKTMALKAALNLDFKHALYLECNTGNSAPLNLLQALLSLLYTRGLQPDRVRNKGVAFNKVVEKLQSGGRMLLIDEADGLPAQSLNILRQIHDATGIPVVLVGRPNLRNTIDNTMRVASIGGSLRGRISIEHNLMPAGGTNPSDGGTWLFSEEEVRLMLAKRRIQITRDAARWLCALANISLMVHNVEKGGLRFAIKVAVNAATLNKTDKPLDREMLIRAHRLASERDDVRSLETMIDDAMKYTAATAAG